jgi:hypothetical protein
MIPGRDKCSDDIIGNRTEEGEDCSHTSIDLFDDGMMEIVTSRPPARKSAEQQSKQHESQSFNF